MSDQAESQPEQLLNSWLAEDDPAHSRETLTRLIAEQAEPVVRRIVSFKLSSTSHKNHASSAADIGDVCNEALGNLLSHLASLKAASQPSPRNFDSYVAVTAFNACNEYFRERSPARYSLSNRLRYLLTHDSQFALWQSEDGREIAGLAALRGGQSFSVRLSTSEIVAEMADQRRHASLIDTVAAIFHIAKGQLIFETLLETAAQCTGLREAQSIPQDTGPDAPQRTWERIPDAKPRVDSSLVGRQYVARLWTEICTLPLQQRAALLLNLKDSAGGDIQLFDWLGIATVQQIAKALEMEPTRFAALWKDLPLDDSRIALELGIQRQDVINRRSSARKRLAYRMKEYDRGN